MCSTISLTIAAIFGLLVLIFIVISAFEVCLAMGIVALLGFIATILGIIGSIFHC